MPILKMTSRNDIHLPSRLMRTLNLGDEKFFIAIVRGNSIVLTPVDVEPRYSTEALKGAEKLVKKEKEEAAAICSKKDIEDLFD